MVPGLAFDGGEACQLFVPRHPATRMAVGSARAAEAELDIDALVRLALDGIETVEARFPTRTAPASWEPRASSVGEP